MSYFHVRIATKSGRRGIGIEVELDVEAEELESRFLEPYRLGKPIVIAGKTVAAPELDRIQIYETEYDSDAVNAEILARGRARNVARPVDTQGRLDPLILSKHGVDVTKRHVKGPPGHAAPPQGQTPQVVRPAKNAREVFVVHGRNNAARDALFEFLRAIDLHPLEWSEAVSATGRSSPYIGEILDAAFSSAHAVVVLFTPDDEARLKKRFRADNDPPHETQLTGQARPNVLFEAGMAMARDQARTVLVELGSLRPFSDVAGRHAIRLDNTSQRRQELAMRLRDAGCPVSLEGTDWHTAGDFEIAIVPAVQEPSGIIDVAVPQHQNSKDIELSAAAIELLSEAKEDENRMIVVLRTMTDVVVRTNRKHFGEMNDKRSQAKCLDAIEELLNHRLVQPYKGKGEAYEVTHRGFQVADSLAKGEEQPIEQKSQL